METTNKQNAIVEVEGTGGKGQDRMVNRSKSKLHVTTRTLQKRRMASSFQFRSTGFPFRASVG
jgi:hypothetical protein